MSAVPIVHVDLHKLASPVGLCAPETLIVFWYGDWPVGQTFAQRDDCAVDGAELSRKIVDPAVLLRAKAGVGSQGKSALSDPSRASVVICTRDRPDELARCLASLGSQTRPPNQIVVVDNASLSDRTRQIAIAAGAEYVREDRPGLDIARNTGAIAATGDFVAYTDDDVILHPRWLERLLAAFTDEGVMAVTGLVLPAELETDAQQHFEKLWGFGRGYQRIDFGPDFFGRDRVHGCPAWEIGAGASMAFRRGAFERVGLFDERLDVGAAGSSGDTEYWHRVLSMGWLCRYEPSAVAYHYHRRDFPGLSRQIFSYLRGHAASLLVQFEHTGKWGNLRRAFVYLPCLYGRRWLRRYWRGSPERDRFLFVEIRGFLSGILYYLTTPRKTARTVVSRSRSIPVQPRRHP